MPRKLLFAAVAFCFAYGSRLVLAQEELQLRPVPQSPTSYQVYEEAGGAHSLPLPAVEPGLAPVGVQGEGVPAANPTPAGECGCTPQCCRPGLRGVGMHWHCRIKPWLRATHWGYPEYFVPEPLGVLVHEHFNTQVGNAQAAQLILYRCDFVSADDASAAQLNAYGQLRLRKMVHVLSTTPLPLMIEGEWNNSSLNMARRNHVLGEFAKLAPAPIEPERVLIVEPSGPALHGIEASEAYNGVIGQRKSGGLPNGASGGGNGSFKPSSFKP